MSEFEFKNKGYGKYWVKLLHRDRNGSTHSIKEYEVSTLITLDSDKDYLQVLIKKVEINIHPSLVKILLVFFFFFNVHTNFEVFVQNLDPKKQDPKVQLTYLFQLRGADYA